MLPPAATASSSPAPTPRSTRSTRPRRAPTTPARDRGGALHRRRRVGLHRPADLRPRGGRSRHRQPQGGPGRQRADVEGFLPVVAPASAYWLKNEHYAERRGVRVRPRRRTPRGVQAIVEAGLLLQVDDAVLMHEADTMMSRGQDAGRTTGVGRAARRALNHALRGIPEDRVRYHVCWGSWHGPHAYRPAAARQRRPAAAVNAGYYSIEQANPATSTSGGSGRTSSCPRAAS